MSRECENCPHFGGFDEDGCPDCDLYTSFSACPYNAECPVKEEKQSDTAIKIEVDTEVLNLYIIETLQNTVKSVTEQTVEREIGKVVTEAYKAEIQSLTQSAIARIVDVQVTEFMAGNITIGGGWCEKERTLTRTDYMSELVEKALGKQLDANMRETAQREVKSAIDKFSRQLKDEINAGVKQYFDAATRQVLTENVVSMLMSNDTYRRLSESMTTFLPGKTS